MDLACSAKFSVVTLRPMRMMSKRQLVEASSNIMHRWSKNFSPKFSVVISFANHIGVVLSNDLEIIG